jgi:hypothetical protein
MEEYTNVFLFMLFSPLFVGEYVFTRYHFSFAVYLC